MTTKWEDYFCYGAFFYLLFILWELFLSAVFRLIRKTYDSENEKKAYKTQRRAITKRQQYKHSLDKELDDLSEEDWIHMTNEDFQSYWEMYEENCQEGIESYDKILKWCLF
ncbi:unnamed protein product [Caenorhabditis angaria]|uniref:Uncharacterized protein n=1 Tax=Caenorhabditis angaria TaxID=860376 RepID=A0A9P1IMP6_9PELO|nr:unnamed protein product [Caenorhabditis angaria]